MGRKEHFVTGKRREGRQTFAPLNEAEQKLVEENWPFLLFLLDKIVFDKELYLEEAKSIGALAMMRASKTWDPNHKSKRSFVGYCSDWIRNYVVREIRWFESIARHEYTGMHSEKRSDEHHGFDCNALVDPDAKDDATVAKKEQWAKIRLALRKLKPADRELLTRVYFGGEQHTSIAREQGKTRAAVSLRVKYALQELKKEFANLTPETV